MADLKVADKDYKKGKLDKFQLLFEKNGITAKYETREGLGLVLAVDDSDVDLVIELADKYGIALDLIPLVPPL